MADGTKYWVGPVRSVHYRHFRNIGEELLSTVVLCTFWTLFAGLLLLHLVCYVWFILRIRPLGAIDYVVSGPFEVLLLALLLKRGMRYLELDRSDD